MRCYMLWNCSGYAPSEIDRHLETFDSIEELKRSFDRRQYDSYYPMVHDDTPEDGGPVAYVYFYDPRNVAEPYPDRLLHYGPRGGLVLEHC